MKAAQRYENMQCVIASANFNLGRNGNKKTEEKLGMQSDIGAS